MKKGRKIVWITFSGIIFLIVIACLLIAEGAMNGIITRQLVSQANKVLNATVSIGELSGNPFTRLSIHNLTVVQDEKELLRVGEVELDYNLLRLLNNEIVINSVKISDLKADIRQESDSVWSFQKLYKADDTISVSKSGSSFNMLLKINEIECERFLATIHPLDTASVIPKIVETNLSLSFLMKGDVMELKMKRMVLKTSSPDIELKSLIFNYFSDSASYNWDHFQLQLPRSLIVSEGKFYPRQSLRSSGLVKIDTLAFDDIRKFYPPFSLKGNPSVVLSAEGGTEKIDFSVLVKEQLQSCEIKGWVKSFEAIPEYELRADIRDIDGSSWTGNPEYATKITGTLLAKGIGYDPQKAGLTVSGNFPEVIFQDKKLNNLIFKAEKDSVIIDGNLATDTWFGGVMADFRIADFLSKFRYSILGSGRNINLAKLDLPKNLYSSINLKIKAEGEGLNPLEGSLKASVTSSKSTITNRPIDDFHTTVSYQNGNYDVTDFNLNTPFFLLLADGKGNVKRENTIQFSFETKDFNDLLDLTGYGEYSLNGKIEGGFSGSTDRYQGNSTMEISSFGKDSIFVKDMMGDLELSKDSSFSSKIRFNAGEFRLDSILFQTFGADLIFDLGDELSSNFKLSSDSVSVNDQLLGAIKGEATLLTDDSLRLDVQLKLDSFNYSPFKTGASNLNMKARLPKGDENSGLIAVLHQLTDHFNPEPFKNYLSVVQKEEASISGKMDLQNLSYDTLTIGKLGIEFDAVADRNNYKGTVLATGDRIDYQGFKVKESILHSKFANKNFQNELNFAISDSVSGEISVDVDLKKNIEIGLRHLLVESPTNTWVGGGDSTRITYGNNLLEIENLSIAASELKYFKADGIFALKGNENLDVELHGFDLGNINEIVGGTFPVSGAMDASLQMTGTSGNPIMNGEVTLNNLTANDQKIDQIKANLLYRGDTIELDGNIDVANTRMLEAVLKGHYHFSIEDPAFRLPSTTDYLSAKLKLNRFDLSLLNPYVASEGIEVQGFADSDFKAEGSVNDLNINGYFNWTEGQFHMPEYGMLYDHVSLTTGMKGDSLFITDFVAEAGTGSLKVNGFARLNQQNIYEPKALSLKISGKEFKVADSDRLQATINADISLKKETENPVFAGKIEVIRSEANADAFLSEYYKAADETDPPMLIKALESQSALVEPELGTDTAEVKLNPGFQFYKDLKGTLNVQVPGNMWIRGKDMSFEVKGNLRAMKEGDYMTMYGDLEVKRGFYKIYGKRFVFKSGKITLTGEEDINPILDFVVVYSFRDVEKNLSTLQLTVTGRLKDPTIAFELNGVKIEEQDALSYLVFGSSMEQLSDGQRSSISASTTGIAKNMALGQMTSILKDALQSSLNLDVIEIAGEDSWNMGSVTIGKYISKNLFVSYQYTFALDKKTKIIEPQKISIEYQLFNFLSLTGTNQSPNSGFDIIFKKEFK
ncbi:MAG TPA: translocation/assembly module TamB domain-containing protein [Prolixibacteraceae bacterium]|nr:translocation/assembly module TamB domain-containing protein [Prolixibacteraceae bacterium]